MDIREFVFALCLLSASRKMYRATIDLEIILGRTAFLVLVFSLIWLATVKTLLADVEYYVSVGFLLAVNFLLMQWGKKKSTERFSSVPTADQVEDEAKFIMAEIDQLAPGEREFIQGLVDSRENWHAVREKIDIALGDGRFRNLALIKLMDSFWIK